MSQVTKKFIGNDQVGAAQILLENNTYQRGRNAANSADIDMFKVNASDRIEADSLPQCADVPAANADLVNKLYVDSLVAGAAQVAKQAVRLVSTSNLALTGGAALSIDGVATVNGDRVLLAGQTAGAENGIYVVSGIGVAYALTRSTDADTSAEVIPGMSTFVSAGNTLAQTLWFLNTLGTIVLNTTVLSFVKDTNINVKQSITLNGTDITNQYVDLSFLAKTDSVELSVSGVMQAETDDYTLSTVGGVTRLTFAGGLATGGASELIAGDVLKVFYQR